MTRAADVVCFGTRGADCERTDELLELLGEIRSRWGNTEVRYRIQWGDNALWMADAQKKEIAKLQKRVKQLRAQVKRLRFALENA